MQLIFGRAPTSKLPQHKFRQQYGELFDAVRDRAPEWIGVPATEVVGQNLDAKCSNLRKAASACDQKVQIIAERGDPDILFCRQRTAEEIEYLAARAKRQIEARHRIAAAKSGPKSKPVANSVVKPPQPAQQFVTPTPPKQQTPTPRQPAPKPPVPKPVTQRVDVDAFSEPGGDPIRDQIFDILADLMQSEDPDDVGILDVPASRWSSIKSEVRHLASELCPQYEVVCERDGDSLAIQLLPKLTE